MYLKCINMKNYNFLRFFPQLEKQNIQVGEKSIIGLSAVLPGVFN